MKSSWYLPIVRRHATDILFVKWNVFAFNSTHFIPSFLQNIVWYIARENKHWRIELKIKTVPDSLLLLISSFDELLITFLATLCFKSCRLHRKGSDESKCRLSTPVFLECRERVIKPKHNDLRNIHDEVKIYKPFWPYCPFVRGIHRSKWISPHKGTLRMIFETFSLLRAWTTCWINSPSFRWFRKL